MSTRPLLMIPGPTEISPAVLEAAAAPPPGHLAPAFVAAFGRALRAMRSVWLAPEDAEPFILPGSGTLAMESAVQNLVEPGDVAVVVNTGYFSDRLTEMARRRGVRVVEVGAQPGAAPEIDAVARALDESKADLLFVTHVDTSTGVRTDAAALAALARERDILSVFDGVCATAAEAFDMAGLGADVYLTASQKAIGAPPGLALLVAGPRAIARRESMSTPPALTMDWLAWRGVMRAYADGKNAYFATPATSLVRALDVSLQEILAADPDPRIAMTRRFADHERTARALRAAWRALDLVELPRESRFAANTLSALLYPPGRGPELVARILEGGVVVAGGLHPAMAPTYFRIGHMGWTIGQRSLLERTITAVARALDRDPAAPLAVFAGCV